MMHYHGTPITPRSELYTLAGRNFCVSFARPEDVKVCHEIGQSVMLDNGAYSAWTRGRAVDWDDWASWAEPWLDYPTTWSVAPDVIDGDEYDNDMLLARYSHSIGAPGSVVPVWHLHESFTRLARLVDTFGRVCFGSSGAYRTIGTDPWHRRVADAFNRLSDEFGRVPWVHMLRGMSLCGSQYPFASVDSTDVARNHNRQHNTALKLAARWDAVQCPSRWVRVDQLVLEEAS